MDLMDALQALRQKEVLLGLHRKTFKIVFNTQNNFIDGAAAKPKQTKQSFDLDRLTLEEQVELLDLIAISSRSEDEVYGVKLRGIDGKIIDEAVEVEVINDNIKHIEKFVKLNQTIVAPTLIDIKQIIQQRLLKAAAKVPKR
jgi:AAA15 family ATPase/GTPase